MKGAAPLLPHRPSDLSATLRRFLADRLLAEDDLSRSADLEVELRGRCSDLEASLADLGRRFSESIAAYAFRSGEFGGRLGDVCVGLIDLRSSVFGPSVGSPFHSLASRFVGSVSSFLFF